MTKLIVIGDLRVWGKDPCNSLVGQDRQRALRAFKAGDPTTGLEFWHEPFGSRATEITNPALVDWSGLREGP